MNLLRRLYRNLSHDDTPMVRRAVSQRLGEFAKVCELEHIKGSDAANKGVLMQIYTNLATDEQVRFTVLKSC